METVKRSVVARGFEGQGEGKQAELRTFRGSENTLYDTLIKDTCHYTHIIYNTKSEL